MDIPSAVREVFFHSGDAFDAALAGAGTSGAFALPLAQALRSLWSLAPAYFLRVQSQLAAVDQEGASQPTWVEPVRPLLDSSRGSGLFPLPQSVPLKGHVLAVESLAFRGQALGAAAIALPEDAPAELRDEVRTLLNVAAVQLAPRLHLRALERQGDRLRQELAEQTPLANIAELAGLIVHESNNFLNVVGLQLAVMEPDLPEAIRPQIDKVRGQVAGFKSLVQQFQARRQRHQPVSRPVDLNQAVRDAVEELARQSPSPSQPALRLADSASPSKGPAAVFVHLDLAPDLPLTLATPASLKRLVVFLLSGLTVTPGRQPVTLQTRPAPGKVLLRVEEPNAPAEPWRDTLDWLTCQGLVRRLQGTIARQPISPSGTETVVTLPVVPS